MLKSFKTDPPFPKKFFVTFSKKWFNYIYVLYDRKKLTSIDVTRFDFQTRINAFDMVPSSSL